MHRSGAAERDQCEVARLDALLHGKRANGLRHLRVDHVADALRQLDRLQAELMCELADRAVRGPDVERHLPAGEPGGIDAAEDDVRVGHRRTRPTAAVTGGAGIGACALRPDA